MWDDWKASVSHGVVDLRLHTLFISGELNELNNAAWQAWVQGDIQANGAGAAINPPVGDAHAAPAAIAMAPAPAGSPLDHD